MAYVLTNSTGLGVAVAVGIVGIDVGVGVGSGVAVLVGDGRTAIAVGLGVATGSGVGVQTGVGDGITCGVAVGNVVPDDGKSGVTGDTVAVAAGNQKFGTLFVGKLVEGRPPNTGAVSGSDSWPEGFKKASTSSREKPSYDLTVCLDNAGEPAYTSSFGPGPTAGCPHAARITTSKVAPQAM